MANWWKIRTDSLLPGPQPAIPIFVLYSYNYCYIGFAEFKCDLINPLISNLKNKEYDGACNLESHTTLADRSTKSINNTNLLRE